MATIKNTTTGEIIEVTCIADGQDILADVMGGSGIPVTALTDEEVAAIDSPNAPEWAYALDANEAAWWTRWAAREERILAAYEDASEDERRACEEAISDWTNDPEAQQDAEEIALGLAGFAVTVDYDDDASEAILLLERFGDSDRALERMSGIIEEGNWPDNTRVTVWEVTDGGKVATSIDCAALA